MNFMNQHFFIYIDESKMKIFKMILFMGFSCITKAILSLIYSLIFYCQGSSPLLKPAVLSHLLHPLIEKGFFSKYNLILRERSA